MRRIRFIGMALAVLGAVFGAVGTAQAQAPAKKPNILFIVSDDTGYGDLGPYGGACPRRASTAWPGTA